MQFDSPERQTIDDLGEGVGRIADLLA